MLVDIMDMKQSHSDESLRTCCHVTFNWFHGRDFHIMAHDETLQHRLNSDSFYKCSQSTFQPIGSCSSHLPFYSPLSCLWFFCQSPQMGDNGHTQIPADSPASTCTLHTGVGVPVVPGGCHGYCVICTCVSFYREILWYYSRLAFHVDCWV